MINMNNLDKKIDKLDRIIGTIATSIVNHIGDKVKDFLDEELCEEYEDFKKYIVEFENLCKISEEKHKLEMQKFHNLAYTHYQKVINKND